MAARAEILDAVHKAEAMPSSPKQHRGLSLLLTVVFTAGAASPLLGLALSVVHSLLPGDVYFQRAAMAFTFVSIPLLLIGAHLMDVIDTKR